MSDALNLDLSHSLKFVDAQTTAMTPLTMLASSLSLEHSNLQLASMAGRLTPLRFDTTTSELVALQTSVGIYDLGWLGHIGVRGEDRLRWLSGMVTNAVQQLPASQGNYSFFLNAQGRIQGDAFVYRQPEQLLLAIEADQIDRLLGHLDHFIIMDDVTLVDLGEEIASIGLAGPEAAGLLGKLGLIAPELPLGSAAAMANASLGDAQVTIVNTSTGHTPRYEVWSRPDRVLALWKQLIHAGARPCGLDAVEALRVLEATPRYGVDVSDRDLPQETNQTRALNFNKGCYLGQEIVERIRSRGAVHRSLRQFTLTGKLPSLPAELMVGSTSIGKLTSAIQISTAAGDKVFAIGIVRTDALTRGEPLTYNEGTAVLLDRPPALPL